jgi:hypothetical protein
MGNKRLTDPGSRCQEPSHLAAAGYGFRLTRPAPSD